MPRRALLRFADHLRWLSWRVGYGVGPRLASALRRRWVLARHPNARIVFGRNVYLGPGFSLDIPGRGSFIVGDNVGFRRGFRAEIADGGQISIGSETHLTYEVVIACSTSVTIGERCAIAQGVFIVDGNHCFRDLSRPMIEQGYDFRPVTIGDDVLINSKCTIVADVGTRAVVGANAAVVKPVPAYTVAVGVPAEPVSYFGPDPGPADVSSARSG